jgi:hypothetical protein
VIACSSQESYNSHHGLSSIINQKTICLHQAVLLITGETQLVKDQSASPGENM